MSNLASSTTDPAKQLEELANRSLHFWDLPSGCYARLINISENATFFVEDGQGYKSVLRMHRENYHTFRAIQCELLWIEALRKENYVVTPAHYSGKNGAAIQSTEPYDDLSERYMVLFEFVAGEEPSPDENLVQLFEHLGEIAAKTHNHSLQWQRPDDFERLVWDADSVFGAAPKWGGWRQGPGVSESSLTVLEKLEQVVLKRLDEFGQSPERYGLIHADMRLANLLVHGEQTTVIDFDDCGMGWYLYDFAAGISFMEEHPQVPQLKQAWLTGYRKQRSLSEVEEQELDTFVMLRRMALLGWMGTHPEVEVVQELSPNFCENTVKLAKNYLEKFGEL